MFKAHLFNKNSGFVLIEAMIGMLLLAFAALGLAYSFNKLIAIQKTNNLLSILGLQMKEQMSNSNISSGYTTCTTSQTTSNIVTNFTITQSAACSLKTVQLTFGDGSVTSVSLPITEYSVSNSTIGTIPYKFTN